MERRTLFLVTPSWHNRASPTEQSYWSFTNISLKNRSFFGRSISILDILKRYDFIGAATAQPLADASEIIEKTRSEQ
jgi:hypothetical protein